MREIIKKHVSIYEKDAHLQVIAKSITVIKKDPAANRRLKRQINALHIISNPPHPPTQNPQLHKTNGLPPSNLKNLTNQFNGKTPLLHHRLDKLLLP